jgi:protein HOOK3
MINSDSKWFKQLSHVEDKDKRMLKFSKLKKLHLLLTRYYEDILGLSTKNIDTPNLNAIAKDDDLDETMKLCSLIVTLAVTYNNKAEYIEKIQSLNPVSQQGLMLSIEGVRCQIQL